MGIRETLILITILAWGCTPRADLHELGSDHPANPAAPEGRPIESSTTLRIGDDLPSPDVGGAMQHTVGSHQEMNHGDHRGEETGQQVPDGAARYQCPMHPEVTSSDPDRRCPKCNMKINKSVGGTGSRTHHEGHGGHTQ